MRSAIYEGVVVHERTGRQGLGPTHRFRFSLTMLLLDLEEIDEVTKLHFLWRAGWGPALVRIRRADLPGDRSRPADEAFRSLIRAEIGKDASGPIQVLYHPRTFGWLFNPISCAYMHDESGQPIGMVAEVTNTPWHERHIYVLGAPGTHIFRKEMHVSPFLPPDGYYRVTWGPPDDELRLAWDFLVPSNGSDGPLEEVLRTRLLLHRKPLGRASMSLFIWRPPFPTHRISGGIYRQAFYLARAGATFFPHPDPERRWRMGRIWSKLAHLRPGNKRA